ncbi:hypothetical protein ACFLRM_02125 [Acidobacteriota bacterium]
MKNNKFSPIFFIMVLLIHLSCSSSSFWKLKIDVPVKAELDLEEVDEIVIADFFIKKETALSELNKELVEYFTFELVQNVDQKVSSKNGAIINEEVLKDEEYWKKLSDKKNTVFLTGSAQYSEETRKAIIEKRKKRYEDPFPPEPGLRERKFYTLLLNLFIIDPQTGKPLYERTFKETQSYDNPNQTAYFAFFDLVQKIKLKFFRSLLGQGEVQERYLISN